MLSERRQTQKATPCVIPLMCNVQNRQIHGQEVDLRLPGAGASFGGDGNVLKLVLVMDVQCCEYTKNTELYMLKG